MTNIFQFTPPKAADQSQQDYVKAMEEHSRILNDHGQRIRAFYKSTAETIKFTGAFAIAIGTLSDNHVLSDNIPDSTWTRIQYTLSGNQEAKGLVFTMSSTFREHLVPEYGIQNHKEFVHMTCEVVGEDIIPPSANFPDYIGQDLAKYYASFVGVDVGNLLFINYHILFRLIEQPGMMYIKHGVIDGVFEVQLLQLINEVYWKICYKANYLPILLDNQAIEFNRQLQEQEGKST